MSKFIEKPFHGDRAMGDAGAAELDIRLFKNHLLSSVMLMSHDIRGDLVSAAAALKLLMHGTYGKMDEGVTREIDKLYGRITGLIGLSEEFLGKTVALTGSLPMKREPLNLNQDIVEPILRELSAQIQTKHITVHNGLQSIPNCQAVIKGSRIWLKSVFRNLLRNAITYGGNGCTIATGFENLGSSIRLNVRNSGKPVPVEYRNGLFETLSCEGIVGRGEGMGIGLFLIKQIIRQHRGDIWYEAMEDGSNFVFTLPRS